MAGARKSALAKAFDSFLSDAFGSSTTVTSGGRVVPKSDQRLRQLTARERIEQARRQAEAQDDGFYHERDTLGAPPAARQRHSPDADGDTDCTEDLDADEQAMLAAARASFRYPDDPAPPMSVVQRHIDLAAHDHPPPQVYHRGRRHSAARPQAKIDPRNRLLRPTVGFAAKHVDAAQFIEQQALAEGGVDGDGDGDGGGGGGGDLAPSGMVKKAFRHLHDALAGGGDGDGTRCVDCAVYAVSPFGLCNGIFFFTARSSVMNAGPIEDCSVSVLPASQLGSFTERWARWCVYGWWLSSCVCVAPPLAHSVALLYG